MHKPIRQYFDLHIDSELMVKREIPCLIGARDIPTETIEYPNTRALVA
jgi:hypothetical protein